MKPRRLGSLLWFPFAFAALFVVVALAVGTGSLSTVVRVVNESGKVLAAAGCLGAAYAFEPGDYMRRAWLYTGACLLLLLARDVTIIPVVGGVLAAGQLTIVQGALVVVANASSVVGAWLLARAWTVAGLDEAPAGPRWALRGGGVALSLLVTGWPLWVDASKLFAGDLAAIPWVGSDLGDTLTFALVAPVLQTALALRGGTLLWPWALLTAGGFCWILYDAGWGFSEILRVDGDPRVRIAIESMRALACTFIAAAGAAQRSVVLQDGGGGDRAKAPA
ncbi:MAG TPA: hypothetical protein VF765_03290 [Polyangiaceae bacterium]